MTTKEFELLLLLMENMGRALSTVQLVLFFRFRTYNQYGRVAFCTDFFQNIKPVPAGQHDIKHDKPCAVSFVQQQGFFG